MCIRDRSKADLPAKSVADSKKDVKEDSQNGEVEEHESFDEDVQDKEEFDEELPLQMKMKRAESVREQMMEDFQRRRDMMLERRMDSKLRHDRARSFAQRQAADSMRRQRASDERQADKIYRSCLLYTSPSPRDATLSRMPSSA